MTSANGGTGRSDPELPGPAEVDGDDPHLQRIRRLGRQLFGVAECRILLGREEEAAGDAGSAFCRIAAGSARPLAVTDARRHPALARHPAVTGEPYIRFFASHPVNGVEGTGSGSIALFDAAPRSALSEGERGLLADLAALVERELELRAVNALQLDLQKKNKNLRRRSLIDPLLGTWNRGAIMRILALESERCEKAGVPLSLIVADLDFFKKINDTYGHPVGDTVLVKVASRLRSCIRPQEALGRYGGEEFLIVLPGAAHATALQVAERMRAAVAAHPEAVGADMLSLTISAGVASTEVFPQASADELISRADMALYVAKDAGRNRVVHATPDLS
ncbi:MAG TPA: sensor domain-containing diguanylate cyclase [Noviherbaspirillum sp.]|jgi:diguanylate cyclase (GGDEF)-like protein|uniref:sensor domain-containing diguanylate cyclase n=1 Tax=Noviherbaspirillum sp. TaxID=1926288 RepID=UPI002F924386